MLKRAEKTMQNKVTKKKCYLIKILLKTPMANCTYIYKPYKAKNIYKTSPRHNKHKGLVTQQLKKRNFSSSEASGGTKLPNKDQFGQYLGPDTDTLKPGRHFLPIWAEITPSQAEKLCQAGLSPPTMKITHR